MIIFLDIIRGLWLLVLWQYSIQAELSLIIIYLSLFFFAVCDCFFGPAFSTIYPRIIEKRFYSEGNAISNTLTSFTNTVSPLVASLIFVNFGLPLLLLFDAITFLISALSEIFLRFEDELLISKRKVIYEFIDGLKNVKNNKRLKSLLFNGNLTHLFLFPFIEVGMVYLLFVLFKTPETHYGIVRSSISAGAIFSGFIAIKYQKKYSVANNINRGIIWMLGAVGLFMLLISDKFCDILYLTEYLPVLYLSITCFVVFFSFGFYGVFFRSFYQLEVSQNMLGRFISIMIMTFSISRLFGMLLYGYLFETGNLKIALIILTIGMSLKIVVHIPFLKYEKYLSDQEMREYNIETESNT